jgi:hypothetical protein
VAAGGEEDNIKSASFMDSHSHFQLLQNWSNRFDFVIAM